MSTLVESELSSREDSTVLAIMGYVRSSLRKRRCTEYTYVAGKRVKLQDGNDDTERLLAEESDYNQMDFVGNIEEDNTSDYAKVKRENSYRWNENDNLPNGWRKRVSKAGKHFYLASNGKVQFSSGRVLYNI